MHDNNQRYLIYINLFTLFTFCLEINTIDRLIITRLSFLIFWMFQNFCLLLIVAKSCGKKFKTLEVVVK